MKKILFFAVILFTACKDEMVVQDCKTCTQYRMYVTGQRDTVFKDQPVCGPILQQYRRDTAMINGWKTYLICK